MTAQANAVFGWTKTWRMLGWGGAALILLLPLIAGAPWTLLDYLVMGTLLLVSAVLVEFAFRSTGGPYYRAGAATAVATGFLLSWVNLGPGLFGLIFVAVIAVAMTGSLIARFRAAGMKKAMVATSLTQAVVGLVTLAALVHVEGGEGLLEGAKILIGTGLFTGLWLLAAALFRASANRKDQKVLAR